MVRAAEAEAEAETEAKAQAIVSNSSGNSNGSSSNGSLPNNLAKRKIFKQNLTNVYYTLTFLGNASYQHARCPDSYRTVSSSTRSRSKQHQQKLSVGHEWNKSCNN
ncbi:hypothetical protein M0802_002428 [Mischocyttarus mexicanus]|nr:hypothetical protein M0802_002428 [Mischocyttarus mexicanus]